MSVETRTKSLAKRFDEPDYTMAVAQTLEGDIVGFADWGPNRHAEWAHDCELFALYLLPSHQGLGVGRRLLQAAAADILEGGPRSMLGCVLAINPHLGFYTRLGGTEVGRGFMELAGEDHELVYFGWSPTGLHRLAAL